MAELFGIENLKKAVHVAIALPTHGIQTIKNKFQLFDILAFINDIRELAEVWRNRSVVKLEAKDVHPSERLELLAWMKSEFTLTDQDAEALFEDSLTWVNSGIAIYERIRIKLGK